MKLSAISRLEVGRQKWDAFANDSDEAWFWHRFDWQDALSTWPQYSDMSLGLIDVGSGYGLIALIPLHVIEGTSLNCFGGIAFQNGLNSKQRAKALRFIEDHLRELARKYHLPEITATLAPMAPAYSGSRCPRVNPLLQDLHCENTLTQTWVVDLSRPTEEICKRYSDLTKRELRKTAAEGFAIREARGASDLTIYYDLHCETYHRTGVPPHPVTYFKEIFEKFLNAGLCRIVFLERDGEVVAAQNTALYKKRALYWTGASRSEKVGGENRVLFHNQIMFAKARGFEWYETGEAFPNVMGGKSKGLNDFKRSFGGELLPFYRGRIEVEVQGNRAEEQGRSVLKQSFIEWLNASYNLLRAVVGDQAAGRVGKMAHVLLIILTDIKKKSARNRVLGER